jgi:hypothetical protein
MPQLPLFGRQSLRVAQISGSAAFDGISVFPPHRWSDLQAFGPNILVGAAADLQRFVQRMDLRTVGLTTVDHAIFVLTALGDQPLTDVLRVVLWQRFGVPVYELYLDESGVLLAAECEAQDGWHIQPGCWFVERHGELLLQSGRGVQARTGLPFAIETDACSCGRPGARIRPGTAVQCGDDSAWEPQLAAVA